MKSKSLLFVGICLLIFGILLRKMTSFINLGLILILTGVLCKTVYIFAKAQSGEYKPGKELIILGVGLFLFLFGIYLRSIGIEVPNPTYLIVSGICLKIIFIIRFIQIVRNNNKTSEKDIHKTEQSKT